MEHIFNVQMRINAEERPHRDMVVEALRSHDVPEAIRQDLCRHGRNVRWVTFDVEKPPATYCIRRHARGVYGTKPCSRIITTNQSLAGAAQHCAGKHGSGVGWFTTYEEED